MVSPSERKLAIKALRSEGLFEGVWILKIVNLVMESHHPKALAMALMLLKKYASSDWGSIIKDSVEERQLCLMIDFLLKYDDPLLPMMSMIILNRFPRFHFELALFRPDEVLAPWKVYLSVVDGMIGYSVLGPRAEPILQQHTSIPAPEPFNLDTLRVYQDQVFREMSKNRHLLRHDREWSVVLLDLIFQTTTPLPFALIVAKLGELSAWHHAEAVELLQEVFQHYPVWIAEVGFLNAFLNLSLDNFRELDFRIENLPTFATNVLARYLQEPGSCPNYSFTRELCLYLGLSLNKEIYRELYDDASGHFFRALQINPHEFLEIEDAAASMSSGR